MDDEARAMRIQLTEFLLLQAERNDSMRFFAGLRRPSKLVRRLRDSLIEARTLEDD